MRPDDKKSPLLQPNYEHKQLVVIDFEYCGANVRGYEFANHFTEWCYDYHDESASFALNVDKYPTPEEQYRFVKSYVSHRPEHPHPGTSTPLASPLVTPVRDPSTPSLEPSAVGSSSSIVDFMLDARVPPGGWKAEETRQEDQLEEHIKSLMEETRLWRPICSAMWIAWGILQAKIPSFDSDGTSDEEEGDPHAFDYLGYAQERAMFFWGDCVALGLVKLEELPERVRDNSKFDSFRLLFPHYHQARQCPEAHRMCPYLCMCIASL